MIIFNSLKKPIQGYSRVVVDMVSVRRRVSLGGTLIFFSRCALRDLFAIFLVCAITFMPFVSTYASEEVIGVFEETPAAEEDSGNDLLLQEDVARNESVAQVVEEVPAELTLETSGEAMGAHQNGVMDEPLPEANKEDAIGTLSSEQGISYAIGNVVVEEIVDDNPIREPAPQEQQEQQESLYTYTIEGASGASAEENNAASEIDDHAFVSGEQTTAPTESVQPAVDIEALRAHIQSELEAIMRQQAESELRSRIEDELRGIVEDDVRRSLVSELTQTIEQEIQEKFATELEMRLKEERESIRRAVEQELKPILGPANLQQDQGFRDAECTLLSDSEMYCYRGTRDRNLRETLGGYTGVRSAQDRDGDFEVFLEAEGEEIQLTDNIVDDIAPVRDTDTGMIAWQSMVAERWHVFVYSERDGTIRQLSQGNANNIAPHADNGVIVWQTWNDNNWDIMRAAYDFQSRQWSIESIAKNPWHEVEPVVSAGFVIWRAYIDNAWQIFVYELASGNTVQASYGKGDNRNPRLAILWDSVEEGIHQTLQYNISTGAISVLETGAEREPFPKLPPTSTQDNKAAIPAPASSSTSSSSSGGASQGKNENEG